MTISSLTLRNFRNFTETTLHFSASANGLVGANGHGKTNILEALYMLSSGSRWRSDADSDVLRFGQTYCVLEGLSFEDSDLTLRLQMELRPHSSTVQKKYLVNGISRTKAHFSSYIAAVLFHPEDVGVVNGSPSSRRSLLDQCISEAFPYYRSLLSQYSRVITSRNKVLERIREGSAHENQLEYWTDSMIRLGSELYTFRYAFFTFLRDSVDDFVIQYSPHITGDFSSEGADLDSRISAVYRMRVESNIRKEIMSATSQYGPHKDDYSFFLGERDIGRFGSRGEQRAALFNFKKAHVLYIEHIRKMKPILLLDDIFSEFDKEHRDRIATLCSGYQTFVTGTETSFFESEMFPFDRIFRVSNGTVVEN